MMHSLSITAERLPTGWLARTTIAGFVALAVSTAAFVVASAVAGSLGEIYRGTNLLADWMYELTHNPITELGRASLWASLAIHLTVGMFWAVLYALIFEPRLQQSPPWQSGVMFSMLPFFLSVTVFLPLTGGGLFGSNLEAGPLPLLGNLVLHLIYGATLGAVYGAGADRAEAFEETETEVLHQSEMMGRAEASAALGILIGGVGGGVLGTVLGAILPFSSGEELVGSWPLAMGVLGALAGGAVGALIGSMAGLTEQAVPTLEEPPGDGQPIAAALLPFGVIAFVAVLIVSIGSALLTVGGITHCGHDQSCKDAGYNQAIIVGLGVLTVVTAGAALIDRMGRGGSEDSH
jgi:hypothetical protein